MPDTIRRVRSPSPAIISSDLPSSRGQAAERAQIRVAVEQEKAIDRPVDAPDGSSGRKRKKRHASGDRHHARSDRRLLDDSNVVEALPGQ